MQIIKFGEVNMSTANQCTLSCTKQEAVNQAASKNEWDFRLLKSVNKSWLSCTMEKEEELVELWREHEPE